MTIQSGRTARQLCAAADEALTEAAFRTGGFAEAEALFGEARTLAERDGDREAEALAIGGLGMTHHYRSIDKLVNGRAPADADVAAEEGLMLRALAIWQEIGDAAGTARALFGVGLVFQVMRRDWAAAMPYFWQSFGLAEAVEESGDLYGRSEIHRHLGFYYLVEDVRPNEAVRQLGYSLALREKLSNRGGSRARWSRCARRRWPLGIFSVLLSCRAVRWQRPATLTCYLGGFRTRRRIFARPRRPCPRQADAVSGRFARSMTRRSRSS